ncbi:MAG TPA: phytanoyl-CoA dioxygenase family protein [Allosphingosinicella sp.]|jgi:hypothetical protein|uniref:phytanoyl-CoA dioxygenase family protein n=1 Tax=Allosphingosinicella sp. TaxID=2823234 RepID=UPI002F275C23
MQLARDGAEHIRAALTEPELTTLESALSELPPNRPGTRIADDPVLSALLAPEGPIGRHAARHLGPAARPVRTLRFNKTADRNWSLPWHQDRTIAVRARIDMPGFANWTVKSGIRHVEPPIALLERMLTLRLHLDDTGADNAPLLISPGTHRLGRIPEPQIASVVARHGAHSCLAARGDAWAYATPILHASETACAPKSRRVLHIDYAAEALPNGLEWL